MQCLVNVADESGLPSQAVTVFAWSSKIYVVLQYPDGRLCIFMFLEIIKHNMLKMLLFFISSIEMATQKFINFDVFLMHTDTTAVTIQSNKIVSNEAKDN